MKSPELWLQTRVLDMKRLSSEMIQFFLNIFMFGIVGVVGFIFDAGILYALRGEIGLYPAKLVSFFIAVFITWILNRALTFKHRPSGISPRREFSQYFILMIGGGVVNYTIFWLSTSFSYIIMQYPVLGVALGSLSGMVFNYISAKTMIFKKSI
jgi:putative flippase GtrA